MRAVQYVAPGRLEMINVTEPVPGPEQVRVRTEVVGICGSDLHFLHDSVPERYPFPPGQSGHECVGVVEDSRHPDWPAGRRALVIPPAYDAFAEYLCLDAASLIPLPEGLPSERAVMAQQLGTVVFCCRKLGNVLDKTVAVVGQGPAGLLFTALLYHMGARRVVGLDLVAHRLAVAARMGAGATVQVDACDPVEAVHEATRSEGVDLVVEAVGKAETVNLCADLVRERGEVALFGVPKAERLSIDLERFLRRNVRIHTSVHAQREPGLRSFRLAVDLLAEGRLDVGPLLSHRLPFRAVERAFHLAETKDDGAVKVLLEL